MANREQQPGGLQRSPLSATQFLHIWNHFDSDGDGYIEEKELESFFRELEGSWRGAEGASSPTLKDKVKDFLHSFDHNKDGRVDMSELAEILPNQEKFALCFRQFVSSSADFLQTWRRCSAAGISPPSAEAVGGGSQASADRKSSPRVPAASCLLLGWTEHLEP